MFLICFVHSFLKLSEIDVSENVRFLSRILSHYRFASDVIVLPAGHDLSDRIKTEEQDDRSYAHGFLGHRLKIAKASRASRMSINGRDASNQYEKSHFHSSA